MLDSMQLPVPYTLEGIAACVVKTIREVQREGPYYLGGWCLSGLLAYETAQQIIGAGQQVALLALIDTRNWSHFWKLSVTAQIKAGIEKVAFHIANLRENRANKTLKDRLGAAVLRVMRLTRHLPRDISICLKKGDLRDADQILYAASRDYRPHPYPGSVLLFQSSWHPTGTYWEIQFGWRELVENGLAHQIPADHAGVFCEPAVGILASKLSEYLHESRAIEKRKPAPRSNTQ
jgi:thioesterase domain-containing protein